MNEPRRWIAVLGSNDLADLQRHRMRELQLAASVLDERPAVHDRVALLHRGRFLETGIVAKVLGEHPLRLRLRRTVQVPEGASLPFTHFGPVLACATGWTFERLDDLTESFIAVGERDFSRVEGALLALALRYGPPPKRPKHRRPRTPGRRRLVAASATAFRRPR